MAELEELIAELHAAWPREPEAPPAPPVFPLSSLPEWMSAHVETTAGATQTPEDLPALIALATLAAGCGGRVKVEPSPGWVEGLNLFVAVLMMPGNRKSAVFKRMISPLQAWEEELQQASVDEIAEASTRARIATARADKLAAKASATDADPDAADEAVAARAAADRLRVPTKPRVLASDATPEVLAQLLYENGGRLALMSEEGGVFDQMAGRYSSGQPNLDVYLQGYSNTPLLVDRKGHEEQRVDEPALTIGLAVQPEVMRAARENNVFQGRGLIDRFISARPPSLLGERDHHLARRIASDPVTKQAEDRYNQRFLVLLRSIGMGPTVLPFAPDAGDRLDGWTQDLEPRLRGDLEGLAGWISKLYGNCARVAGLLHVARTYDSGWEGPVDLEDLEAAIAIAEYLLQHAMGELGGAGGTEEAAAAARVLEWLRTEVTAPSVTRREVQTKHRRKMGFPSTAEDFDRIMDLLAEQGWVALLPEPTQRGRGGQVVRWALHPELMGSAG